VKFCINRGFDYEAAKLKDLMKAEVNKIVVPVKTAEP
jgi:hypothetical protein